MRGLLVALALVVASSSQAGDLTLPSTFVAGTPAIAAEVNANFGAVEAAVNDNDARITTLEADIFSLGVALHFLPQSGAAGDLANTAARGYELAELQYRSGVSPIDDVRQWSDRWRDAAYLAAADDPGRLTALEDHADRMADLLAVAQARFQVGLAPEEDVRVAEYASLAADTVVEGFIAKTGL